MLVFTLTLLLSILSNSLPKLRSRVMPLSFKHLPLSPVNCMHRQLIFHTEIVSSECFLSLFVSLGLKSSVTFFIVEKSKLFNIGMQRLTVAFLIVLQFSALVLSESQPAENVPSRITTEVNYSQDMWTYIAGSSQEHRSTSWENTSSLNMPSSRNLPRNDFTIPITTVSMSTRLVPFIAEGMDFRCETRLWIEQIKRNNALKKSTA